MNSEWLRTLATLTSNGLHVWPRGQATLEVPQHTVQVNMRSPVLTIKERKLSYRFMAAEAYWILSGSDKVEHISPWNAKIAEFSDDGDVFFGAYGPKIVAQLPYMVDKLIADPDTRQAGLTIWRESPPKTKDVPCTVAIFASIREGKLNLSVYMRSSDVWLGLPYDVFNFSMLGHLICCRLNDALKYPVIPGTLYLTAASCHLYQQHWAAAHEILHTIGDGAEPVIPEAMVSCTDEELLMKTLKDLRDAKPGSKERWWEQVNEDLYETR